MFISPTKKKTAETAATVRRLTARLEAHYMSNKSITEEQGKINENVFLLFIIPPRKYFLYCGHKVINLCKKIKIKRKVVAKI